MYKVLHLLDDSVGQGVVWLSGEGWAEWQGSVSLHLSTDFGNNMWVGGDGDENIVETQLNSNLCVTDFLALISEYPASHYHGNRLTKTLH